MSEATMIDDVPRSRSGRTAEAGVRNDEPCTACNGNGWVLSLPRGCNPFLMRIEQIEKTARKVSCWRCAVDRAALSKPEGR